MKKIGFNDRYCLTQAVLEGRKTMTRRIEKSLDINHTRYKLGEIVAVAQSYNTIKSECKDNIPVWSNIVANTCDGEHGCYNKMFVKPSLMPHQIQITGIRIERLQDITDEDCLREGIMKGKALSMYTFHNAKLQYGSPRAAFSALIDKPGVGGKGTWQRNPFVVVYQFKLVK